MIQTYAPAEFRGRAIALFHMSQVVMTVGSMAIGSLAAMCGTQWAVALMGAAGVLAMLAYSFRAAARMADSVGPGFKPAHESLRCPKTTTAFSVASMMRRAIGRSPLHRNHHNVGDEFRKDGFETRPYNWMLRMAMETHDREAAVEIALERELPICDAHHHLWERPPEVYLLNDLQRISAAATTSLPRSPSNAVMAIAKMVPRR